MTSVDDRFSVEMAGKCFAMIGRGASASFDGRHKPASSTVLSRSIISPMSSPGSSTATPTARSTISCHGLRAIGKSSAAFGHVRLQITDISRNHPVRDRKDHMILKRRARYTFIPNLSLLSGSKLLPNSWPWPRPLCACLSTVAKGPTFMLRMPLRPATHPSARRLSDPASRVLPSIHRRKPNRDIFPRRRPPA